MPNEKTNLLRMFPTCNCTTSEVFALFCRVELEFVHAEVEGDIHIDPDEKANLLFFPLCCCTSSVLPLLFLLFLSSM